MDTKLPTHRPTGKPNIIFFGDSISFGEFVNPHLNWVTRLSSKIENQYDSKYLTINCSINGNTTRQALERMPFDVQRYGVEFLCAQFGMNDCNYWETDEGLPRVSADVYHSNLKEIVYRGYQFGARIVFLPTSHPTPHNSLNKQNLSYEQNRKQYSQIVRKVAIETNSVLIDVEKHFENTISETVPLNNLLMPDGIHLSPQGHDLYTDIFWPIINKYLD